MKRGRKREEVLVVLPARYASTRFPGKVLALLNGKPVVWWCWEAAVKAKVGPVLVATEDARVKQAVERLGGRAVLTSPSCRSGSDRVREAARSSKARIIVNLQADEPLIDAATIRRTVRALQADPEASIGTAAAPLLDEKRVADPNTVKVVFDRRGRALYFSRSPIPFVRRRPQGGPLHWQHIGIYAWRRAALERFVKLKPSLAEQAESLEQLRAMDDGMRIAVARVAKATVGVDTRDDLERVSHILAGLGA